MPFAVFWLGLLWYTVQVAWTRQRERDRWPRIKPAGEGQLRDSRDLAMALAFASFYERCGDKTFRHFLTEYDRERVRQIVCAHLRNNRDALTEMHLGPQMLEEGEHEVADQAVAEAASLFLKI